MERYEVKTSELHPAFDPEQKDLTAVYLASEVDAVLKRQASAAISGMNAATAISSGQLEQARRLRAESSPEALESERLANAILTNRIDQLQADYDHEKIMRQQCETRISELERALRTYGGHKELCTALIGCPCDCGLSKLMESK